MQKFIHLRGARAPPGGTLQVRMGVGTLSRVLLGSSLNLHFFLKYYSLW